LPFHLLSAHMRELSVIWYFIMTCIECFSPLILSRSCPSCCCLRAFYRSVHFASKIPLSFCIWIYWAPSRWILIYFIEI
jgi:hypothetical protein